MSGTVLYTLQFHFDLGDFVGILGGLGIIAGMVWSGYKTARTERKEKGKISKPAIALTVFFLLFGALFVFGFVIRPLADYLTVQDAYENGLTLTVKGPVENFAPKQDFSDFYEEFTVDGVFFSNWGKAYEPMLPGYPMKYNMLDRNLKGGGLIREGQWLRIRYVTLPGRGREGEDYHAIVFIEELPKK